MLLLAGNSKTFHRSRAIEAGKIFSEAAGPVPDEFQITSKSKGFRQALNSRMRDLISLLVHVVSTGLRLVQPGGVQAVIAESVLIKHQLLILNRARRHAPHLRSLDRLIAGFCSLWIRPKRRSGLAIAFRPSTFLNFHRAMVQRKYWLLFSPKKRTKPGPKGPTTDLIQAVVEMKKRNPKWGCLQIAEQINLAFGTSINKDVVRRILAMYFRPTSTDGGPSWLTFIGHMKDSLWSLAIRVFGPYARGRLSCD